MTTYEKIIERHGTEIDYLIAVQEDHLKSAKGSLDSWRDLNEHKDSDHDGHYNRKHYIDHFYGMVMGYQTALDNLYFLKDAKECYCFDCKHYRRTTIECINQIKGFCSLFEMMITDTKNVTCEYKDLGR